MKEFKPNMSLPEAPIPPASEISPLAKMRGLMGYVEDGTDTSITIGQDDATGDFYLRLGRPSDPRAKVYYMKSLKGVIDAAFKDQGEPT